MYYRCNTKLRNKEGRREEKRRKEGRRKKKKKKKKKKVCNTANFTGIYNNVQSERYIWVSFPIDLYTETLVKWVYIQILYTDLRQRRKRIFLEIKEGEKGFEEERDRKLYYT